MKGGGEIDLSGFKQEERLWLLAVAIGFRMKKGDVGGVLSAATDLANILTKEDYEKAKAMTKHLRDQLRKEEEAERNRPAPDLKDPGDPESFAA